MEIPRVKPVHPEFSSGPCAKHPGWSMEVVAARAWPGRSHRALGPRNQIREVLSRTRDLLELPGEYRIGIVPASNTGALEMALWNLLGPRPVDVLAWEHFGSLWARDVASELKLEDCRILEADFGGISDLAAVRREADVVFVWNGTTSGACVPNADWIAKDREGLVICDATSGIFAQKLDWERLDATTFSWQKVLGGEGAHGMLVLGPRAVERLEKDSPNRGLPRIFRLTEGGALREAIFDGATINTPSMLCVADCLAALEWAESVGGADGMRQLADRNFAILQAWIERMHWLENLVQDAAIRSNTSVCMRITAPWFQEQEESDQREKLLRMAGLLDKERAAYDVLNHANAPPGFRIWCGATVAAADLEILTQWLEWAYHSVLASKY